MKKIITVITAVTVIMSAFTFMAGAENINIVQPFESNTEGSQTFRIPAIITLNNGDILAAADMRYAHGTDSPNNIDTLVAVSSNGISDWKYNKVNHFDDCADFSTDVNSASFIDSAVAQSKINGRIFIITDAFPSGIGYNQSKKGTGYKNVSDGSLRLALTDADSKKIKDYGYYIGDFNNGFADVFDSNSKTSYSVDSEYNLYRNNEPLYIKQINSDKQIQQNVFNFASCLHVFPTSYLWMRYSDDNGKTWSVPTILNDDVKNDKEPFLGVCPGKGIAVKNSDGERIMFSVYDNRGLTERTSVIYSDDNGVTWNRSERIKFRMALGKTSESQIINGYGNSLIMFARNSSDYVAYSESFDNGETWTRMKADGDLSANGNCMVSVINTDCFIDGKRVILGSFASDTSQRADGIIKVGTVSESNEIKWISTYHINSGFFAYSCLTQLSDGNIGCLYEDEAAHISYKILTLSNDGVLSDITGENCEYVQPDKNEFVTSLKAILFKIGNFFHIV